MQHTICQNNSKLAEDQYQNTKDKDHEQRPVTVCLSNGYRHQRPNLRMKGTRCASGKMMKGCVKDTSSKLSIGSIPSNHQTILNCTHHDKAFGSSQPRVMKFNTTCDSSSYKTQQICSIFRQHSSEENYQYEKDSQSTFLQSSCKVNTGSYSSKGFGSLITKGKRDIFINHLRNNTPGPGAYQLNQPKLLKNKLYFNTSKSSFQKNNHNRDNQSTKSSNKIKTISNSPCQQEIKNIIFTSSKFENSIFPRPADQQLQSQQAQQQVSKYKKKRRQLRNFKKDTKGWQCSFKTKVGRDGYVTTQESPGPGVYQLQQDSLQNRYLKRKNSSQKHSPSGKQNLIQCQRKKYEKVIEYVFNRQYYNVRKFKHEHSPGPCTYDQQIPELKPFYEKIKNSNNFIKGSVDRFGKFTGQKYIEKNFLQKDDDKPKTLDPGQYQVGSVFDKANKVRLLEGSAFMSQSKRQPFADCSKRLGPNMDIIEDNHQRNNFIFNINRNWH